MSKANSGLAAVLAAAQTETPSAELTEEAQGAMITNAHADGLREGAATGGKNERARVAAIINAPEAKGREALAQHLAFNTDMAPEAAVEVLKASPVATAKSRLDAAMENFQPQVTTAADGEADPIAGRLANLDRGINKQLKRFGKEMLPAE